MSLCVGKVGRRNFTLPLEVATQAMAIHGVRGKGKTVTAAVIVEELLGRGVQVVVIDPTDGWWGLKSSADGKSPGHDVVILGGPHGDLPLQSTAGSVIADFAVDHGASLILSLRHLRKSEQRRYVTDFAEQLYHRKGEVEHRTPLFTVLDEASQFVPQRVMGDSARMVGAIQDIARLGRSCGLGLALVDQRPASVNKDALTQIELLVCHAVTSPQDRKALDEWISQKDSAGHRDEFLEHLASLPRGEAWFWFPIEDVFQRVSVRMRSTFDSSKTPGAGETPKAPESRAEVDLEALRAQLQETIEEAEANDPKALKKRIAELERELRTRAQDAGPGNEEVAAEIRDQVDRELGAALEHQRARLRPLVVGVMGQAQNIYQAAELLAPMTDSLAEALEDKEADLEAMDAAETPVRVPRTAAPRRSLRETTSPAHHPPSSDGGDVSLPSGERKILTAVAQHDAGVTREQLTVLTAYKRSSRDTYLQRLRAKGFVDVQGPTIRATDEGIDALGADYEPLPTGAALRGHWLERLPQGERAVLEAVIDGYPNPVDRSAISDATGYKRSSRDTYLQRLTARRLVAKNGSGTVRASDELFD